MMDTMLTKVSLPLYHLVKTVQASFAKKVEAYRDALHDNPNTDPPGSPLADLFHTFVEGLSIMDVGENHRGELQKILRDIEEYKPHQRAWIERRVTAFHMTVTANKENAKFTMCFRDDVLRHQILNACGAMRATFDIKHGAAPPGWLEDDLQCWLEGLTGRG